MSLFPDAPVRLIDTFGEGGGPDLLGRALAPVLADRWGHPVAVENHPGVGSTAGTALVARSPADGHTVLVSTSAHAYGAAFALDLPYDPLEDFVPVAPLTKQPYVLVAGSHAGFTTLAELISSARARPGSIRFGSSGIGTAIHVGVEVLKQELEIDVRHVPAHGDEAIADTIHHLLHEATDFAMAPIAITPPHLREGRLIALGVTTARRSRIIPDVVTLAEAGPADFRFDFPIWYGTWVPSKTRRPRSCACWPTPSRQHSRNGSSGIG